MRRINCYIPIKLSITGRLADPQLDQLSDTLVRALSARIAFAERTIASAHGGSFSEGSVEIVRQGYDPARDNAESYQIASYDRAGQTQRVPVRRGAGGRRWRVQTANNIRLSIRRFAEYLEGNRNSRDSDSVPAQIRSLYADRLDEVQPAAVWLVVANQSISLETLVEEVAERFESFVPAGKTFYYSYTTYDSRRRALLALDSEHRLTGLPDMYYNPGYITPDGTVVVGRGGMVLFVELALAEVTEASTLIYAVELNVTLTLRELSFIINPDSFERLFRVSWENYVSEFGNQTSQLRILPVYLQQRAHFQTLKYLVEQTVVRPLDERSAYFGNLYLLNQSRLDWLPAAAQAPARSVTDDITLPLDESRREGMWDVDWCGAYIYAVVSPSERDLNIARFRPEARRLADLFLAHLQGDRDLAWRYRLLGLVRQHYIQGRPRLANDRALAFEFLLEQFELRNSFDRFFTAVEAANLWELHEFVINLATNTLYAYHPRVLQTIALINSRRRENLFHRYIVTDTSQELWLDKLSSARVLPGMIVGQVISEYIKDEEIQRIRPDRQAEFERLLMVQAQALIEEILSGQNQQSYTEEQFAEAALQRTVAQIGPERFQDRFVEEVDSQLSARLIGLTRVPGVIERYEVTFELVKRINGGAWETVPGSRTTITDGAFEDMLAWWPRLRGFAFITALSKVVVIGAVAAIAWEVGAVGFLLQLGGGTATVVTSIAISTLIYYVTHERHTLEGFLLAALDGYLFAVGFRFGGLAGRGIAGRIGTQSFQRLIGGWVAERLVVGTLGGAGSAALRTFSHDVINIALGRGGFSSPEDYIRSIGWGAMWGVVFEFGIGAFQPILRAGGQTGLQTLSEVARAVLQAGRSPAQWMAGVSQALARFWQQLARLVEPTTASGQRLLRLRQTLQQGAETIAEQLAQAPGQAAALYRLAVFRRVLELSEAALTRQSVSGLEKLLNLSRTELSNEAVLALLNRLHPTQLRNFLEGLNTLDPPIISALSRSRQLDALADTPQLASVINNDEVLRRLILSGFSLPAGGRVPPSANLLDLARSRLPFLQRHRAASLRADAIALEREAADLIREAERLERIASGVPVTNPDRERLLRQAARMRRVSALLPDEIADVRLQAGEFESGARAAAPEFPTSAELDQLFETAQHEGHFIRVPLQSIDRRPGLLRRLVRPLLRSRSGNRVVFRVEGGGSRQLITVDEATGQVTIASGVTIHLNFGSLERAVEFIQRNRPDGHLVIFEVDERWFRSLRSVAMPQHGTEAVRRLPRSVDVRAAEDQLEITSHFIDEFQQVIIQGTGRVVRLVAPPPTSPPPAP